MRSARKTNKEADNAKQAAGEDSTGAAEQLLASFLLWQSQKGV
jgi:hypothetical protein